MRSKPVTGGNGDRSTDAVIVYVMRRMRAPLITLIVVLSVSLLGLVLIPGQEPDGTPWHMSFFEAFYFVSYTATTIGFGELPYPFNAAQRLWVTFMIYPTVIAWLYAFGAILSLIQDPVFRHALLESAYSRHVRRIKTPFHLVCGYGDTGQILVRTLSQENQQMVVIDIDQGAIDELRIEELKLFVPGLSADAAKSAHLIKAGITHPYCHTVVAITDDDRANLKIAISSKLLNPKVQVICRAESKGIEDNMASFGTDRIINPFNSFADTLEVFLFSAEKFRLRKRLFDCYTNPKLPQQVAQGHWIICGFGRLGQAVYQRLASHGLPTVVIEANRPVESLPEAHVIGRGTEAVTLMEADILHAAGIVAATDDDADNLSIIMTARELHPRLYLVGRQNVRANDALFDAAAIHMRMQINRIVANHATSFIATPLFHLFMAQVQARPEPYVAGINTRLNNVMGEAAGDLWQLNLTVDDAPAICRAIANGQTMMIRHLIMDPWSCVVTRPAVPLALQRHGTDEVVLMPELTTQLAAGDSILLFGRDHKVCLNSRFSIEAVEFMLQNERAAMA
ncbi:potassium channel family protein [Mariprofundus erugo]|uniref:Potassium channel family protein n=1 Tax=Mariprofundus erugo TaxID=2528639 RepID=A0A5R9GNP0_9PROT|nr:potassium channel family protein [Mariprofundus erugo]TLS66549.1 potassium channel family protein [Mariprofundus erugo]